jgi:hypothetical protein
MQWNLRPNILKTKPESRAFESRTEGLTFKNKPRSSSFIKWNQRPNIIKTKPEAQALQNKRF